MTAKHTTAKREKNHWDKDWKCNANSFYIYLFSLRFYCCCDCIYLCAIKIMFLRSTTGDRPLYKLIYVNGKRGMISDEKDDRQQSIFACLTNRTCWKLWVRAFSIDECSDDWHWRNIHRIFTQRIGTESGAKPLFGRFSLSPRIISVFFLLLRQWRHLRNFYLELFWPMPLSQ